MITAPGVALGNRYRLERRIAVGGMGEVWQAYDESLTRPVAVKVLRDEYAGDSGFLARFRTEARNSAALSHPNIATLLDYGEQGGSAYLVMELVVGEPLSDVLERTPVLTASHLIPVLAQTARGLAAAHEAGVVHRDIKPGNILIARGGRVKITDFGVSRASGQPTMTASGMVMGTAQYLSPEQAVGKPATPLSDLYSVGIVAYEALVGHRPFTGPTAVDIAVAHVNDPVPPLPASVDGPLGALVMRLLDKDPAHRPQSADELAELFDHLLARTPPTGVPVVVTTPAPAARLAEVAAPVPAGTAAAAGADAPAAAAAGTTRPVPPPSYPPARPVRPPLPRHTTAARHGAAPQAATPASVGRRLGRWRWPVIVGVLLLLLLLGALAATTLTGAWAPTAPQYPVAGQDGRFRIVTDAQDRWME
ncbi:MAG TPA: serine/threonine-protein kinase [Cellulomonas sp.]